MNDAVRLPWGVREAWVDRIISTKKATSSDVAAAYAIARSVYTTAGWDPSVEELLTKSGGSEASFGRSVKRLRAAGAILTTQTMHEGKRAANRFVLVLDFDVALAATVLVQKRRGPRRAASLSLTGDVQSERRLAPLLSLTSQCHRRSPVSDRGPPPSLTPSLTVANTPLLGSSPDPDSSSGHSPEVFESQGLGVPAKTLRARHAPTPTASAIGVDLEHVAALAGLARPRLGFVSPLPPAPPVEPKDGLTPEEREESLRELRERRLLCAKRQVLARTTPFRGQDEPG